MRNPDEIIDLYRIARLERHRYGLDQFEAGVLRDIQAKVEAAKRQIISDLDNRIKSTSTWSIARSETMIRQLEDLSLGLRAGLGEELRIASGYAGSMSAQTAYEVISVNGLSPLVDNLRLSPMQMGVFFNTHQIFAGGYSRRIPEWIDAAYGQTMGLEVRNKLLEQWQIGALRGQGYAPIVRNIMSDGFDKFQKHDIVTLTRTFFAEAQSRATDALIKQNEDVINGWEWLTANDDRVCIICLSLSGNYYHLNEPHPPMPIHPRCRCVKHLKTKSWHELGIDLPELDPIEKAVSTYGYEDKQGRWVIPQVGTGGARVKDVRFFKDGIGEAFGGMPDRQQLAMLGRRRFEMFKNGEIGLKDLVNPKTGRVILVKDLEQGVRPKGLPARPVVPAFVPPAPPVAAGFQWSELPQGATMGQSRARGWNRMSFRDSDDYYKSIADKNVLPEFTDIDSNGCWQNGNKINMGNNAIANYSERRIAGSYRHEYAHYLDEMFRDSIPFTKGTKNASGNLSSEKGYMGEAFKKDVKSIKKYFEKWPITQYRLNAHEAAKKEIIQEVEIKSIGVGDKNAVKAQVLSKRLDGVGLKYDDVLDVFSKDLGIDHRETALNRMTDFILAIERKDIVSLDKATRVPSEVYRNGMIGKVSDYLAALTKNDVGFGHSDEYWKRKGMRNAEAFADYFALKSSDNQTWAKVLEIISPEFTAASRRFLDEIAKP